MILLTGSHKIIIHNTPRDMLPCNDIAAIDPVKCGSHLDRDQREAQFVFRDRGGLSDHRYAELSEVPRLVSSSSCDYSTVQFIRSERCFWVCWGGRYLPRGTAAYFHGTTSALMHPRTSIGLPHTSGHLIPIWPYKLLYNNYIFSAVINDILLRKGEATIYSSPTYFMIRNCSCRSPR